MEETGYELGLEEWTVLWPTESREEKGPWRKNAMSKRGWHKSTGDDKRTKSSSLGLQGSRTVRKAENEAKNTIVKNLDS